MDGSIRITRDTNGFVLLRRDTKTHEVTERLYVGDAAEMRGLAEALTDTADAFDVVERLYPTTPSSDR